jgi:hypothetical protein
MARLQPGDECKMGYAARPDQIPDEGLRRLAGHGTQSMIRHF